MDSRVGRGRCLWEMSPGCDILPILSAKNYMLVIIFLGDSDCECQVPVTEQLALDCIIGKCC